jgi:hypothetical protein
MVHQDFPKAAFFPDLPGIGAVVDKWLDRPER